MFLDILLLFIGIFLVLLYISVFVHMFFFVPYVPSKNRVVKTMIRAAKLKPRETVFDLGCGDARLLLAAEKHARVKTVGFEIAPLMYLLSQFRKFLARSAATIRFQNFFHANLRQANVIFCYLIPNVMPRLAAKIKKECRKGTRIISNTFHIPGLRPHRILKRNPRLGLPTIYVYKV